MPTSWEQKRAAIAAALAGGNPQSVGAGPMVNPMINAMSPQAPGVAGGSPGLMGAAPTQGQMMAQANASLQGAPGFDYVAPPVGPPPVPVAAAAPGQGAGSTPEELRAFMERGGGRYAPVQGVLAPRGGGSAAFIANNRMRH